MPIPKRPVTGLADPNQQRRDRETLNQVLDHSFDDSRRQTAAEKNAGITPVNPAYAPGDIRRYGALSDASTDCQPAISAAIAQAQAGGIAWYVPTGAWLINSAISVPNSTAGIAGYGNGIGSVIKKNFNGDMLTLGTRGQLIGMFFDGNGANFTGRGILVSAGTNPDGYQFCQNVRIWETASHCLEFTSAGVGFGSLWHGCFFKVANNDIYCVKMPTDGGTANRMFFGCEAPFDSIMDLNNSANTQIVGGLSGRSSAGGLWCLGWGATCSQALISGVRLAGGGQTALIKGTLTNINGCDVAGDITFDTGCTSSKYVSNNDGAITITDNSGSVGTSANEFDTKVTPYTPTISAAGGSPAIGDGTITASYTRIGRAVLYAGRFTVGSTTNMGTGEFRISLPFQAHTRNYNGAARALDTGTEFLTGVCEIPDTGVSYMRFVLIRGGASAANFVTPTVPITWATGDQIWWSVTYDV